MPEPQIYVGSTGVFPWMINVQKGTKG